MSNQRKNIRSLFLYSFCMTIFYFLFIGSDCEHGDQNVIADFGNLFNHKVYPTFITIPQNDTGYVNISVSDLPESKNVDLTLIDNSIAPFIVDKLQYNFNPNPINISNPGILSIFIPNTVQPNIYDVLVKFYVVGYDSSEYEVSELRIIVTTGTDLWKSQTITGSAWPLNGVHFTDIDHGFAVGEFGTILKTTNGGSDWIQLLNANTSAFLYGVQFLDSLTGYILGDNTFLYTPNGGDSWIDKAPSGVNADINGLYFLNSTNGWLVGSVIRYTGDGGNNWVVQLGPESGRNWTKISFVNDTIGVVVGNKNGVGRQIRYTTDGGTNWNESTFPAGNQEIISVCFSNDSTAFAVSDNKILKSLDGGKNWTELNTSITEALYGISFGDDNNGWVIGFEKSYRTTNGGVTWVEEFIAIGVNFFDVYFINSNTGYAVGSVGAGSAIYRRK